MKKTPDSKYGPRLLCQSLCLTLLLLLCPTSAEAETLTGKPYVTDGDTVKISGERIRLEGIDAPEWNQRCKDASGKGYDCGIVSTAALRNKIGRNSITCEGTKRDRYGRFLGVCYLNELDLNGWMVRNGYALAYSTLLGPLCLRRTGGPRKQPRPVGRGVRRALELAKRGTARDRFSASRQVSR